MRQVFFFCTKSPKLLFTGVSVISSLTHRIYKNWTSHSQIQRRHTHTHTHTQGENSRKSHEWPKFAILNSFVLTWQDKYLTHTSFTEESVVMIWNACFHLGQTASELGHWHQQWRTRAAPTQTSFCGWDALIYIGNAQFTQRYFCSDHAKKNPSKLIQPDDISKKQNPPAKYHRLIPMHRV